MAYFDNMNDAASVTVQSHRWKDEGMSQCVYSPSGHAINPCYPSPVSDVSLTSPSSKMHLGYPYVAWPVASQQAPNDVKSPMLVSHRPAVFLGEGYMGSQIPATPTPYPDSCNHFCSFCGMGCSPLEPASPTALYSDHGEQENFPLSFHFPSTDFTLNLPGAQVRQEDHESQRARLDRYHAGPQERQTPNHDPLPTLNAPSAKHLDGLGLPSRAEPELRVWTMIEEDRLKQQELDLLRDVQHAKRLGFDERDPKSGVPSAVSELKKELERTKEQRDNSILDHFNVFTVTSDNLDPLYYLESSLARLLNQRLPVIDRRCKFPREPVDHDQIYALLSEWQEDQTVFFGKEEH